MQLRMSPGGRTSNSRRRRPELPPSSVTVTTAVMSMAGAYRLSPCNRAESPVPPPIETIRSGVRTLESVKAPPSKRRQSGMIQEPGEIGIAARGPPIPRIEVDRTFQTFPRACEIAGKPAAKSQRIVDVVGPRLGL